MDSNNLKSKVGHLAKTEKLYYYYYYILCRVSREGGVVVAVGAEDEALALCPPRVGEQLEVVQRALVLLVLPHHAPLGQTVGVVARLAEQPLGLRLHKLHVPAALAAPSHKKR